MLDRYPYLRPCVGYGEIAVDNKDGPQISAEIKALLALYAELIEDHTAGGNHAVVECLTKARNTLYNEITGKLFPALDQEERISGSKNQNDHHN
jgi:hypothetical protein